MSKLFGTDGTRGIINDGLSAMLAFRVGMAVAQVTTREKGGRRPRFTIGRDTRIPSDLLERALIAGLCSAGADVLHLGAIPTSAMARATVGTRVDTGIVISISHNPFKHNGVEIFSDQGFKPSDELGGKIEEILLNDIAVPLRTGGEIGRTICADGEESQNYIDRLVSITDSELVGLHILVDCASGTASTTTTRLFDRFPDLHIDVIHTDPSSINVNNGYGSTHLDQLKAMVKASGCDLGIAFDGDAGRCLMVDGTGEEIDGDQVIVTCGLTLKEAGELADGAIVGTVMSNLGLHRSCREHGTGLFCTSVNDRNMLEKMEGCDYIIGGEQSGYTILRYYAATGDGQLTALQFLDLLYCSGKKASELMKECKRYLQVFINVPVADKAKKEAVLSAPALQSAVAEQEEKPVRSGRVLARPSGTEVLIRVMVRVQTEPIARETVELLINAIKNHGS